jgi:hypothetical protein
MSILYKGKLKVLDSKYWYVEYQPSGLLPFTENIHLHPDVDKTKFTYNDIGKEISFHQKRYCKAEKNGGECLDAMDTPYMCDCIYYAKPFEPFISNDFQIGPDGAYEHTE